MVHSVNYPPVPTYYIATGDNAISYGLTGVENCTTTGLANLEAFTNEEDYVARLLELGIDIVAIEEEKMRFVTDQIDEDEMKLITGQVDEDEMKFSAEQIYIESSDAISQASWIDKIKNFFTKGATK